MDEFITISTPQNHVFFIDGGLKLTKKTEIELFRAMKKEHNIDIKEWEVFSCNSTRDKKDPLTVIVWTKIKELTEE